jgi:hypothetical protein
MSGTETVSGPCPVCGKAMFQKYETSLSGFMFDACFSCGYASGECDRLPKTAREIWQSILQHFKHRTIAEFNHQQSWTHNVTPGQDPLLREPIFVPDAQPELQCVDRHSILNPNP